jgi:hypothetical protein
VSNGGKIDFPYGHDAEGDGYWTQRVEWLEAEGQEGRAEWTPEMRAAYRSQATPLTATELCPAPLFYNRLVEAIEQHCSRQWPLAVVVLQIHEQPPELPRQQALEMALRLDVREGDVPTRLCETTFAVLLPDTGSTAVVVAARLQRALSNITGKQVTTGIACYPEDATTALELLQMASDRSS